MEMEIGDEFIMGSNDRALVVKGRRTKRHRSSSPYKTGLTASSSSSGCRNKEESGQKEEVVVEENCSVFSSTTTSSYVYESTEEEEDMANCLILLAQGDGPRQARKITTNTTTTPFTYTSSSGISKMARKFSDFATSSSVTTTNKVGFYVYECKTCNRSFPSFQALGGHMASHKKPKPTANQETTKKPPPPSTSCLPLLVDNNKLEDCSLNKTSPYCPSPKDDHLHVSLQIGKPSNTTNLNPNKGHQGNNINKVAKVHECSICGSEFNSGQALGGHMRRHRANTANVGTNTIVTQVGLSGNKVTSPAVEEVASNDNNLNGQDHRTMKPKTVLSLDLNLPAPEDDRYQHQREPKFEFVTAKQALVFSASTLVDCHY